MKKLFELAEAEAVKLWNEIKEAFSTHKAVDTFHVTSDGQKFENADNAAFHGSKLKNKTVAAVSRVEVEAAPDAVVEPALEPQAEPQAEPAAEPQAEPQAEPAAEPQAEPAAEPQAEPQAEPAAEPEAAPAPEPEAEGTEKKSE